MGDHSSNDFWVEVFFSLRHSSSRLGQRFLRYIEHNCNPADDVQTPFVVFVPRLALDVCGEFRVFSDFWHFEHLVTRSHKSFENSAGDSTFHRLRFHCLTHHHYPKHFHLRSVLFLCPFQVRRRGSLRQDAKGSTLTHKGTR